MCPVLVSHPWDPSDGTGVLSRACFPTPWCGQHPLPTHCPPRSGGHACSTGHRVWRWGWGCPWPPPTPLFPPQGEGLHQLREALKILAERVLILETMIGLYGE